MKVYLLFNYEGETLLFHTVSDSYVDNSIEFEVPESCIIMPNFEEEADLSNPINFRPTVDTQKLLALPEVQVLGWKSLARKQIKDGFGDLEDQLADVALKLNFLTGPILRGLAEAVLGIPMPEQNKQDFATMFNGWKQAVDAGVYKDTSDVEDSAQLFAKIMASDPAIAEIVGSYKIKKQNLLNT